MTQNVNDNLVLVVGKSASGKSASLMGLDNPEGVMYLNCEAGKKLPFKTKFKQYTITDPLQVHEAFEAAESKPEIHTIVIDTVTRWPVNKGDRIDFSGEAPAMPGGVAALFKFNCSLFPFATLADGTLLTREEQIDRINTAWLATRATTINEEMKLAAAKQWALREARQIGGIDEIQVAS